jgi:hypothetical protein
VTAHDLSEMVGGPERSRGVARPVTLRALVHKPPANDTQSCVCIAPGYSGNYEYEVPAGQYEIQGIDLPVAGVECVLLFDDYGDIWMPRWKP